MVLDTYLLNTQQYKVRIKGKVEQSRERSSALPRHLGVVATEKRAFWSPSTTVANFTFYLIASDVVGSSFGVLRSVKCLLIAITHEFILTLDSSIS